eukprot:Gregarina_sp_Pseudo_9__5985@NODE_985_length_2001_cov_210_721713_g923_i0_p3_GENE_NODE_985_length_2001_cov_210_721713_g923_i0NODE_985_length_2001_cov_210_721713_g923_i0_p3_ORF_typecomplete_len150_score25_41DUF1730/PF08331_10/0_16_NODE_985_length_2001_cov_210_721713_g923_i014221871
MNSMSVVSQPPIGGVGYSYAPPTDQSYYQSMAHSAPAPGNSLAMLGQDSRYIGPDQREYAGTISHVHNVVPTSLFTTYVPAGQIAGRATQAAYANQSDFQKVHENRLKSIREQNPTSLTVYYTDDLYPPYYAKAKKVQSQKRGKPRCCQ